MFMFIDYVVIWVKVRFPYGVWAHMLVKTDVSRKIKLFVYRYGVMLSFLSWPWQLNASSYIQGQFGFPYSQIKNRQWASALLIFATSVHKDLNLIRF